MMQADLSKNGTISGILRETESALTETTLATARGT